MFWGVFFIGLGAVMLLNYVLGIHLPIARILVSLLFIYMGINMLFGSFSLHLHSLATNNAAIFSSSNFQFTSDSEENGARQFKTVFGDGTLDMTGVDLSKGDVHLHVKTVFGETKIYVKKGTPLRVRTKTAFGNTELPGQNQSVMGKFTYQSEGLKAGAPALDIDSDVAFGSLRIIEK